MFKLAKESRDVFVCHQSITLFRPHQSSSWSQMKQNRVRGERKWQTHRKQTKPTRIVFASSHHQSVRDWDKQCKSAPLCGCHAKVDGSSTLSAAGWPLSGYGQIARLQTSQKQFWFETASIIDRSSARALRWGQRVTWRRDDGRGCGKFAHRNRPISQREGGRERAKWLGKNLGHWGLVFASGRNDDCNSVKVNRSLIWPLLVRLPLSD